MDIITVHILYSAESFSFGAAIPHTFSKYIEQGDIVAVDQGYLDFVTEKLAGLEDLTVKNHFF